MLFFANSMITSHLLTSCSTSSYISVEIFSLPSSVVIFFWNLNSSCGMRGDVIIITLGTANQLLRVNTGATALEYFTPDWTPNTGTVTSVGLSASGALNVSGSPITTSGTIALNWTGTSSQSVRGDGSLATF